MVRTVLSDAQWEKMEPHCLGKRSDPGCSGTNNRLFLEAVLWKARTGSRWRDLLAEFGDWSTVLKCFDYWCERGVFKTIFAAVSDDPDMDYALIDATTVPVHRHGQGAKGAAQNQAIGKSRGGWTTKILAPTDALGTLVCFELLPGNRHDTLGVIPAALIIEL